MSDFLTKICSLLNKHGVEYLVIGGVAVIYHGYTRSTADINFWYNPTLTNFHRIINAFKEYGIDVYELDKEVFDSSEIFPPVSNTRLENRFLTSHSRSCLLRGSAIKSRSANARFG